MRHFLILLMLCTACSVRLHAQVTHAASFQLGLTETVYWSQVKDSKTYASTFLPTFAFDYAKYSENFFWAGVGLGVQPRYMALFKYEDGTKIGINFPEAWLRVRAGLKLQGDFLSGLPYLSLGINTIGRVENYTDNGFNNVTTYSSSDTSVQLFKYRPFAELGCTLINSTFRDGKRNVFVNFGVRYYPLEMFQRELPVEIDFGVFKNVQYKLIEVYLCAGIQRNFHR